MVENSIRIPHIEMGIAAKALRRAARAFLVAHAFFALPLLGIIAESAQAQSGGSCPANQHTPAAGGNCLPDVAAELADWCADVGGGFQFGAVPICARNLLGDSAAGAELAQRCENDGWDVSEEDSSLSGSGIWVACIPDNNQSGCANISNGNAQYNFDADPRACQCKHGLGDPDLGTCPFEPSNNGLAALLTLGFAPEYAPDPAEVLRLAGILQNTISGNNLGLAAQRNHAAAVSVLITAGADPAGTHGSRNAAHWVGRNSSQRATLALRLLNHFIGALNQIGATSFDWNALANFGTPLDGLQQFGSGNTNPDQGEALDNIHRTLWEQGSRCAETSGNFCLAPCSAGQEASCAAANYALATLLTAGDAPQHNPDLRIVRRWVRNLRNNISGENIALAAQHGHAAAISLMITEGVNPAGTRLSRNVAHWIGRNAASGAPQALTVLLQFEQVLNDTGAVFDGWNTVADIGTPLDALQHYGSGNTLDAQAAALDEMHRNMWRLGARCDRRSGAFCDAPIAPIAPTDPPCLPDEHRAAAGGPCLSAVNAEMADWCANINPDAIFALNGEQAICAYLPVDNAAAMMFVQNCGNDGWHSPLTGLCAPFNNQSGCARKNNGNAQYNFNANPRACQCNHGYSGNADAGQCDYALNNAGLSLYLNEGDYLRHTPDLAEVRRFADALGISISADNVSEAARLGHAEAMSVLITAGAELLGGDGAHNAAHWVGWNSFDGRAPRALTVLTHFLDAVEESGRVFDGWNVVANFGTPLDALQRYGLAEAQTEAVSVIHRVMWEQGARCRQVSGALCAAPCEEGSLSCAGVEANNAALASLLIVGHAPEYVPDLEQVRGLAAALGTNISGDNLGLAAQHAHARAVSVLITAGADPAGVRGDRNVAHWVGRTSANRAPQALTLLLHFARALDETDAMFDWNALAGFGTALDGLQIYGTLSARTEVDDIHRLLWERGARCERRTGDFCAAPCEIRQGLSCSDVGNEELTELLTAGFSPEHVPDLAEVRRLAGALHVNISADNLGLAAQRGHAAALSVMITAGADPNGMYLRRNVAHWAGRNADIRAAQGLNVLLHFLDALDEVGAVFDGWNVTVDLGTPLDGLQFYGPRNTNPDHRGALEKLHRELWDQGSRCEKRSGVFCAAPCATGSGETYLTERDECLSPAAAELFDWCGADPDGSEVVMHMSHEHTCLASFSPPGSSSQTAYVRRCEDAGWDVVDTFMIDNPLFPSSVYCGFHNNQSACSVRNNGAAEYNSYADPRVCACKVGASGDAAAGECAYPGNSTCPETAAGVFCECEIDYQRTGADPLAPQCRHVSAVLARQWCENDPEWRFTVSDDGANWNCHLPLFNVAANQNRDSCVVTDPDRRAANLDPDCARIFGGLENIPSSAESYQSGDRYVFNCPPGSFQSADFKRCEARLFFGTSGDPEGELSASSGGAALLSGGVAGYGATVTFSATPGAGRVIAEWRGDCGGEVGNSRQCAVTVFAEVRVTVEFALRDQSVYFTQPENGALAAESQGAALLSGDTVQYDSEVIFTAAPNAGYRVSLWGGDCAAASGNICRIVRARSAVTASALLTDIDECAENINECGANETCLNLPGDRFCGGDYEARALAACLDAGWEAEDLRGVNTPRCVLPLLLVDDNDPADNVELEFCLLSSPAEGSSRLTNPARCATFFGGTYFPPVSNHNDGDRYVSCPAELTASGDYKRCGPGVTLSFQQTENGVLSAEFVVGRAARNGDVVLRGGTIIFRAAPDSGYQVSLWSAPCADSPASSCEAVILASTSVSVLFADIDECAPGGDNQCAKVGGVCENRPGTHKCDCAAGFSGDGMQCFADKTVSFSQSDNGTVSADSGGIPIRSGDTVTHGATITFTAAPVTLYRLAAWGGACAEASASGNSCVVTATMHVSVGAVFGDGIIPVRFSQSDNGALSAASGGAFVQDGDFVAHGATVTFIAAPDSGYALSEWNGDCAGNGPCEVAATTAVTVGAAFADIDECAPGAVNECAPTGSVCENTQGGHSCSCAVGFSGDGGTCEANISVSFLPLLNGTISVEVDGSVLPDGGVSVGATVVFRALADDGYYVPEWSGDCVGQPGGVPAKNGLDNRVPICELTAVAGSDFRVGATFRRAWPIFFSPRPQNISLRVSVVGGDELNPLDSAPDGSTVVYTAAPDPGFYISEWAANRVGSCDVNYDNAAADPSPQVCETVATGEAFGSNDPIPMALRLPCDHIPGAIYDSENDQCACGATGHLIFGGDANAYCAAPIPIVCPIGDDACEAIGILANEQENACGNIFGGQPHMADGERRICSGLDEHDTFCVINSSDAFSCPGLFRHVLSCNRINRTALNPFLCGSVCDEDDAARGRECGRTTAETQ